MLLLLSLCAPAWGQTLWGPETFENGAPCDPDQTWVEAPTTFAQSTDMTGDCYVDSSDLDAAGNIAEDGLDLAKAGWKMQLRFLANPGSNQIAFSFLDSSGSALCTFNILSSNLRTGGQTIQALSVDTNYDVEFSSILQV